MADPISIYPLFVRGQSWPVTPVPTVAAGDAELQDNEITAELTDAEITVGLPLEMCPAFEDVGVSATLDTDSVEATVSSDPIAVLLPEEVCACLRAGS